MDASLWAVEGRGRGGWVRARTVALEAVGVGCGLETELRGRLWAGREQGARVAFAERPWRRPVGTLWDHGGQAWPLLGRPCLSKQPPLLCPHADPSSRPATKLARGSSQLAATLPGAQHRPPHKKPAPTQ